MFDAVRCITLSLPRLAQNSDVMPAEGQGISSYRQPYDFITNTHCGYNLHIHMAPTPLLLLWVSCAVIHTTSKRSTATMPIIIHSIYLRYVMQFVVGVTVSHSCWNLSLLRKG